MSAVAVFFFVFLSILAISLTSISATGRKKMDDEVVLANVRRIRSGATVQNASRRCTYAEYPEWVEWQKDPENTPTPGNATNARRALLNISVHSTAARFKAFTTLAKIELDERPEAEKKRVLECYVLNVVQPQLDELAAAHPELAAFCASKVTEPNPFSLLCAAGLALEVPPHACPRSSTNLCNEHLGWGETFLKCQLPANGIACGEECRDKGGNTWRCGWTAGRKADGWAAGASGLTGKWAQQATEHNETFHSPGVGNAKIKTKRAFSCSWTGCGKEFSRASNLKAHVQRHARLAGTTASNGSAGKKKPKKPLLLRHQCSHQGCDFSSARASNIQSHFQVTHRGLKLFKCGKDKCTYAASTKYNLKKHNEPHNPSSRCKPKCPKLGTK